MNKKSIILIALIAAFVVIVSFLTYAKYESEESPTHSDVGTSSTITNNVNGDSLYATTTLTGKFICLPHKNASGPQTMECAYGMKTDNGNNYALDLSGAAASAFDLPMDRRYSVTGMLVPIEAISSDHWKIYDIRGILRVISYQAVTSDIPSYSVNSNINLELKKPIIVSGTTITATAITEDSRCPSDVRCIQAGKVTVLFDIRSSSGGITKGISPGMSITADGLSIALDDVTPYPDSKYKITDGEYRVTVTVKEKASK